MPGGRFGRGRGGRGRGRKGGPFHIRGFVQPALLLLLHIEPRHGYGLMEGLQEIGFRNYPVDSSAVYRTLRQLEESGMVVSDWDTEISSGPPRRVYRLTESGDEYLAVMVADLRATDAVMHSFLEAYDGHLRDGQGEHHE
jgi:PadR family transcriptional regulator, regulatory protein PadR